MTTPTFKPRKYMDPLRCRDGFYFGPTYQTRALPSKAPVKEKSR